MKTIKKLEQNENLPNEQQLKIIKDVKSKEKDTYENSKNSENNTQTLPQTIKAARKLYSKFDESTIDESASTIEATPDIAKTVEDLHRLEKLKKQLVESEDRLKLEVMNYMQMHIYLSFDKFTIASWKSYSRKCFDLSTFKTELPDLYQSYLQETTNRCFKLG